MKYKRRYKRRRIGVPIGYPEAWKYTGRWREKKISPGKWRFKFQATKRRRASTYGGLGRGTTGVWDIKARQYIVKTNKGQYQTTMIGTKKSLGFKVKKPYKRYKKFY